VLVVILAATVVVPRAFESRLGTAPLSTHPPTVEITLGTWTSPHVNVTVTCAACASNVSGGGLVNVTVRVVPQCGKFGCTGSVNATEVDPPFVLRGVAPTMPAPLSTGGSTFQLSVQAPETGGAVFLNGSVTAPPPPGPVVVAAQNWTAQNLTNGTGGLRIAPILEVSSLPGGAEFNETLLVNNSLEPFEDVTNVSVGPPFVLLSDVATFPLELNINQTGLLTLHLRAPLTPGAYTLNGTVFDRPHPMTLISTVNISFVGLAVNLTVASLAGVPREGLGGADLNGSVLLGNPTNRSHQVEYNRTTGPWFFLNGTPIGSFAIPSLGTYRYFFTLYVEEPPGSYPLGLVFTVLSAPRGLAPAPGGISRREPGPRAPPAPGRARCSRGPRPGPDPGPRRRPGSTARSRRAAGAPTRPDRRA